MPILQVCETYIAQSLPVITNELNLRLIRTPDKKNTMYSNNQLNNNYIL